MMKTSRFQFFIEDLGPDSPTRFGFGWQDGNIPKEVVLSMTAAFLEIQKDEYQRWFEGNLGEQSE